MRDAARAFATALSATSAFQALERAAAALRDDVSDGTVAVQGTRAVRKPRPCLLGYGEWAGEASATILGVGRYARSTVAEIANALGTNP